MDFCSGIFCGAIIATILLAIYTYFVQLTDVFFLDQDSAERISEVVNKYPMSLSDCADVLEEVAPLCSTWTAGGFIKRIHETLDKEIA